MSHQTAGTIESKTTSVSVPGLTLVENFLTKEEQKRLIDFVDAQPWNTTLKRRTQHYGYIYDYSRKKGLEATIPIPKEMKFVCDRMQELGYFSSTPEQLIVNEYEPGQGISAHTDDIYKFDNDIVSISLLSSCIMVFESKIARKEVHLPPMSLLHMRDEARYKWTHSIPARMKDVIPTTQQTLERQRRVSLTFRLRKQPKTLA